LEFKGNDAKFASFLCCALISFHLLLRRFPMEEKKRKAAHLVFISIRFDSKRDREK